MKTGDKVRIETKDGRFFSGILMPSTNNHIISLKLYSGYNIGLDKKKIKSSKVLDSSADKYSKPKIQIKFNNQLKTISILHCGGTFASKVSYKTGAVAPGFSPEEIISMFPEIKDLVNIKSKFVGNLFSEDIRFAHFNFIAKEIEKELNRGVDGIIVTHGTDNLALSSCALAFILENLDKPVIFVGAQRSSDRPSSDAAFNIISAINFIIKSNFNEVGICMHSSSDDSKCFILPACKSKKLHTSRRDAFRSVNSQPIAEITNNSEVCFLKEYKKREYNDKLKLKLFNEKLKIGILRSHPNMFASEVKSFSKFNGLVIEGSGLGHFPVNVVDSKTKEHSLILNELKKLAKKIPVVISSNCVFGRVNLNVYDTGRKMQDVGIIGNFSDMITETAFIKLAWLLSNYKKLEIKDLFMKNFRGELSSRNEFEKEFII